MYKDGASYILHRAAICVHNWLIISVQADLPHLHVVASPHAGDFLDAYSCLGNGTNFDNISLGIAIELLLDVP